MRTLTLYITLSLLLTATVFAANDLEERLRNHEQRITRLETQLEELRYRLESGQPGGQRMPRSEVEPMLGRWDCTDGSFRSEIQFEANGRLLRTDLVLGSTKSGQWLRRSKDEIILGNGSNSFRLDFHSPEQVTVTETNTRAKWECQRIED